MLLIVWHPTFFHRIKKSNNFKSIFIIDTYFNEAENKNANFSSSAKNKSGRFNNGFILKIYIILQLNATHSSSVENKSGMFNNGFYLKILFFMITVHKMLAIKGNDERLR